MSVSRNEASSETQTFPLSWDDCKATLCGCTQHKEQKQVWNWFSLRSVAIHIKVWLKYFHSHQNIRTFSLDLSL